MFEATLGESGISRDVSAKTYQPPYYPYQRPQRVIHLDPADLEGLKRLLKYEGAEITRERALACGAGD